MPGSGAHDEQIKRVWKKRHAFDGGRADSVRNGAGGRQDGQNSKWPTPAPRPVGFGSSSIPVARVESAVPGAETTVETPQEYLQRVREGAEKIALVTAKAYGIKPNPQLPTKWQTFKSYVSLGKWARRAYKEKKMADSDPSPAAVVEFDMGVNHAKGITQAKGGAVVGVTGVNGLVFGLFTWVRTYDPQFFPWPHEADIAVSSAIGAALGSLLGYITGRAANWLKMRAANRG